MNRSRTSLAALLSLAVAAAAAAQDARPTAFTNARLVTVSGAVIERGTLVVKNGKIEAVGADVAVPAGARVVDATDMTILPGLVSAWSRAGLQAQPRVEEPPQGRRGRFEVQQGPSGGSAQNRAATKVVDGLHARQPVFGELLRAGITSLALTPVGSAFPGLGAVLRPDGKTIDELTVDDDAFVQIGMAREAQTKKLLKETFEKAQKVVEERKKPPAPPPAEGKPADAKPADGKPADAKTEPPKADQPPKPEPKPEEKKEPPAGQPAPQAAPPKKPEAPKDPNVEVLADLLEGKRRAIVQIDSAADMLHWQLAVADSVKFPRALAVTRHDTQAGTIDVVIEQAKAMQCVVLLPPDLTTLPRTRYLVHPAKRLHDAGIEVGFVLGDSPGAVRMLFFRLMELVRAGLPADVALRAVTLTPAKALGIDARTGSLEAGKAADFLVFRGDPLSPTGQLDAVWLGGQKVPLQP